MIEMIENPTIENEFNAITLVSYIRYLVVVMGTNG